MDSVRPRKEELLYLKAGFRRSLAEFESRQIPIKNLKSIQAERPPLHSWLDSPPLVLQLPREKVSTRLSCFLETKANEGFRRRVKHTAPRFVEDGQITVKVVLGHSGKTRKRRAQTKYPKSYLEQWGLMEETGLELTSKDEQRLRRIKASLDLSLQREYRKEQAQRDFQERNTETRLFQHRNL